MFEDKYLEFKKRTDDYDKQEIVAYESCETVRIDPEKRTVYFKDTYVPFDKILIVAEQLREGFDGLEHE